MEVESIARHFLTIVMLVYTSALDIKTREVEPKLWAYFSTPIYILYVYQVFTGQIEFIWLKLQWLTVFALLIVTYLLYRVGMLGGGDVFAIFIIGSTHYEIGGYIYNWPPAPIILQTLLFASFLSIVLSLYYCGYNIKYNREKLSELPVKEAVFYCFTAKAMQVKNLLNKRYWYPLERPWEKTTLRYFRVEEDDIELLSKLTEWAKKNEAWDSKIWATYGMPFLVYITIGYILALIGLGNFVLGLIFTR